MSNTNATEFLPPSVLVVQTKLGDTILSSGDQMANAGEWNFNPYYNQGEMQP